MVHSAVVDVGYEQLRTRGVKLLQQLITDVTAALHSYSFLAKIVATPSMGGCGLHRPEYSKRCPRRWISGTFARKTSHELRFLRNEFHIRSAAAHVLSGNVSTTQAIDET